MNTSSIIKKLFFAFTVVFAVSCDNDFTDVGSDIIDDDLHTDITRYEAGVVAFDRATGAVQTNNMPLNSLGVYANPAFGTTKAHFVTQLELESENPTIINPVIDTVFLYVPYFSKLESTDASTGIKTYNLQRVYGNLDESINLSIYENGYYLRSTNPASPSNGQRYFSDEKDLVDAHRGAVLLNNGPADNNTVFYIKDTENKREYIPTGETEKETIETFAPGIYMELNKQFFLEKVLNAPAGKLVNNNVFKDYFRGIYFNVEQNGAGGAMAMADFSKGYIKIIYQDYVLEPNGEQSAEREKKSITLNMRGNTVNFFENVYNNEFTSALAAADEVNGDERLYVKGGEGSMAVLNILNEADMAVLKPVTGERVLINEANLTFFVDEDKLGNAFQPSRLYLYDLTNGRPLYDYFVDTSTNTSDSRLDKRVFGGVRDSLPTGQKFYKIRLTNHINNIINKDSANVRLGLVVTEDINLTANGALKTPFGTGQNDDEIPAASVISQLGTILYGSRQNVPEDKRLKLEIFYTKLNE